MSNTFEWVRLEVEKHNRSTFAVLTDMAINYLLYGVFPREYFQFGFYKKKHSDKKTYFTTKLYAKRRKELSNPDSEEQFFNNKYGFAKKFQSYYGRRFMLLSADTPDSEVETFIKGVKKFVYKPISMYEGKGIRTYSLDEQSEEAILRDLRTDKQTALLDEWMEQDKLLSALYPFGLNCIRVTTFNHGDCFELIDCRLSVGRCGDIVNGSLGDNLIALVDVNTGTIISDLTDHDFNLYEKHPITGFKAKGYQLPYWDEVLNLVKKAAKVVPDVAYVGWDVAITKKGPMLIEGNHCGTCATSQFYVLRKEKTGLKDKWDVMHRKQIIK